MSHVTNVLLHVGFAEDVSLEQINAAVEGQEGQVLKALTDGEASRLWGGSKFPEVVLYAAAFNYLNITTFMADLAQLPWSQPEYVQLFIQGQDDDVFTVYRLAGQQWVALS